MEEQFTNPIVLTISVLLLACLAICYYQLKQIINAKKQISGIISAQDAGQKNSLSDVLQRLVKNQQDKYSPTSYAEQDLKNEKKAIAYQYKKLQSVLEVFPDGVIILDEGNSVTFANTKLEALIGLSQDQLIGALPHEWCENKEVLDLLARYESNTTRLRRSETTDYQPSDKPDTTISVSATPISLHSNPEVIVGVLVIFRDVSAEALARRSSDSFIAHVSHELKSPLSVIKMHGDLLLEEGSDEQIRVTSVNVINDEVDRQAMMINDLLNITRLEVGSLSINRQRTRFRDFVDDIYSNMKRQADEQNIRMELELPTTLSHLAIDKDLFRIAVNNILSNAIKYNRKDGLVKMQVKENDDEITITISDTGIGISSKDKEKIFDKFYRADDDEVINRSGHGLGLSLAKEIIHLHNGSLLVESEPGIGTTFKIELRRTSTLLKAVG